MHSPPALLFILCLAANLHCGNEDSGNSQKDGGGTNPPQFSCDAPQDKGTLFYVRANGDNDGDGSEDAPWATIGYAVRQLPDNSTLLVGPGTYLGEIKLNSIFKSGVVIRSEPAYQARLQNDQGVINVFEGQGITISGFDISHDGDGAGPLLIHIDATGSPVNRIVLRNNILHDSYNNDILKINGGAREILIERNIFYNQEGNDEHIDINGVADVVVQDNVFFNDFEASGRTIGEDTSSFVVIKDSNGSDDGIEGANAIILRRNVFLNWQGAGGANFILVGEDGNSFHEGFDITIENNLLVGNSDTDVRAPLGIKGGRDIRFVHNTIVGNMPGEAFAFRFNQEGDNPTNQNISLYNNIWSDPTGTMEDFSDTPIGETDGFELDNNLYWNDGDAIPENSDSDTINVSDDATAILSDPQLPTGNGTMPTWDSSASRFADGSGDVCAAFETIVKRYSIPASGSPAIGAARTDKSPPTDILGNARTGATTVGAYEP